MPMRTHTHAPAPCSRAGGATARNSSAIPLQRRNVSSANLHHLCPSSSDIHVPSAMPNTTSCSMFCQQCQTKNNIMQQGVQKVSPSSCHPCRAACTNGRTSERPTKQNKQVALLLPNCPDTLLAKVYHHLGATSLASHSSQFVKSSKNEPATKSVQSSHSFPHP